MQEALVGRLRSNRAAPVARNQPLVQLSAMVGPEKRRKTSCGPVLAIVILALIFGGFVLLAWLAPDV